MDIFLIVLALIVSLVGVSFFGSKVENEFFYTMQDRKRIRDNLFISLVGSSILLGVMITLLIQKLIGVL